MSGQEHDPTKPLLEPLTRRERDVLSLLAQGLSGPEIAEKLTLAVSSVKWHIQHVYDKLGVSTKRQALFEAGNLIFAAEEPGDLNGQVVFACGLGGRAGSGWRRGRDCRG